jgi:pentapeptide MXKDX repeat protein
LINEDWLTWPDIPFCGRRSSSHISEGLVIVSFGRGRQASIARITLRTITPVAFAEDSGKTGAMLQGTKSKDTMAKDAMSKDSIGKDAMSKDAMAKDSMKKDEMTR